MLHTRQALVSVYDDENSKDIFLGHSKDDSIVATTRNWVNLEN